jgi:hypothetical protein
MGEIKQNDEFGRAIFNTVQKYNLQTILEIGSWDGTGSTSCFIEAMKSFVDPKLVCIELRRDRFEDLLRNTSDYPWVECHNTSTVSIKSFIDNDFENIWSSQYNKINHDKQVVKSWFDSDIDLIKQYEKGFLDTDRRIYDGVLIDGGEFTGYSEFKILKSRTKVIFLDDCYTAFKTNRAAEELTKDPEWELVESNNYYRNGYSIFKKNR